MVNLAGQTKPLLTHRYRGALMRDKNYCLHIKAVLCPPAEPSALPCKDTEQSSFSHV